MSRDDEERAQQYVLARGRHSLYAADRHQMFHQGVFEQAWPPTGEQDYRPAGRLGVNRGELSSLALAFGGNRPDPGQTTAERAARAFNDNPDKREFRVYFRPYECAYEVHRTK
jgi:hypothetical protein